MRTPDPDEEARQEAIQQARMLSIVLLTILGGVLVLLWVIVGS